MAEIFHLDERQVIRAVPFDEFPWLEHGFGTCRSTDWPGRDSVVTAKQIHSNHVLVANSHGGGVIGEGDALIVNHPGTLVAIRTADCLPILMVDPHRRAAAAVHAGWRGTIAEISTHTVERMVRNCGSSADDLIAVIGPGIGQCCFEVGPDVASQFREIFPERDDLAERTRISLAEANRRQLQQAGVRGEQIFEIEECTCCGTERFHSFRRDREAAGRMVSAIGIRA